MINAIACNTPMPDRLSYIFGLLIVIFLTLSETSIAAQNIQRDISQRRIALVIGNADYKRSSLANPINDARQMAMSLKRLGFEVMLKENADALTMFEAVRNFTRDARDNQIRFFYYAGHGLQMYGRNYLLPVDIKARTEEDIATGAVDASGLIDSVGSIKGGINIIVLDTCRDPPIIDTRTVRGPNKITGLANAYAPKGTIVSFSTGTGGKASDGERSALHSIYSKHLLQRIEAVGLPVDELFKQVMTDVVLETGGAQQPRNALNIIGEFCLRPGPAGECGIQLYPR